MRENIQSKKEDIIEHAVQSYVALEYNKRNIAEVSINNSQVQVITKQPSTPELRVGEFLPEKYKWSNNYKIILTIDNIDVVADAILNAYQIS